MIMLRGSSDRNLSRSKKPEVVSFIFHHFRQGDKEECSMSLAVSPRIEGREGWVAFFTIILINNIA